MPTYLLTVAYASGDNEFHTRRIIEAEDKQMVKYHYHRTQKDMGGSDVWNSKHTIEMPGHYITDIEYIERVDDMRDVAERLPTWPKF